MCPFHAIRAILRPMNLSLSIRIAIWKPLKRRTMPQPITSLSISMCLFAGIFATIVAAIRWPWHSPNALKNILKRCTKRLTCCCRICEKTAASVRFIMVEAALLPCRWRSFVASTSTCCRPFQPSTSPKLPSNAIPAISNPTIGNTCWTADLTALASAFRILTPTFCAR